MCGLRNGVETVDVVLSNKDVHPPVLAPHRYTVDDLRAKGNPYAWPIGRDTRQVGVVVAATITQATSVKIESNSWHDNDINLARPCSLQSAPWLRDPPEACLEIYLGVTHQEDLHRAHPGHFGQSDSLPLLATPGD